MKSINDATQDEWNEVARLARHAKSDALDARAWSLNALNEQLARPFGDVDLGTRALAFLMWQQGHPVEWRREDSPGDWRRCEPSWERELCYRVLPEPEELVLPSIDWSHVAPEFEWLAQCENGCAYFSSRAPYIARPGNVGWSYPGATACASQFASFKPGKGDWTRLIVERPA